MACENVVIRKVICSNFLQVVHFWARFQCAVKSCPFEKWGPIEALINHANSSHAKEADPTAKCPQCKEDVSLGLSDRFKGCEDLKVSDGAVWEGECG